MGIMFCSYCGSTIFESDRTCVQCGAPTMGFVTDKKTLKIDKRLETYKPIPNLTLNGWTQSAAIATAQRIEAWTGGKRPTIFCNLTTMSYILPNNMQYRYELNELEDKDINFLGYRMSNDQEILSKLSFITGCSGNTVYFAHVSNNEINPIIGVINV